MPSILLVDDDVNLRSLLDIGLGDYFDKLLRSGELPDPETFLIFTAEDGKEAVEFLENNPISLLVTDIKMPNMNGLMLLGYMNKHHPSVPCIVMSGHTTPELKKVLIKDVLHFIEKPFEPETLGEMIIAALSSQKPEKVIKGISVASFLQIVEMEGQTCHLLIETTEGEKGSFYFRKGELYDAAFKKLKGLEAAMEMIPMQGEKIDILQINPEKIIKQIEVKSLMALIFDAMEASGENNETDEKHYM